MKNYDKDIINILHISDLHFGIETKKGIELPSDFKQKRQLILEDLIDKLKMYSRNNKIHILIISGDIGFLCRKEEYDEFKNWLMDLLAVLDIKASEVIMCPGNHDFNRECKVESIDEKNATSILSVDKISERLSPFEYYENICLELGVPILKNSAEKNDNGKKPQYLYGLHYFEKYDIVFAVFNSAWNDSNKIDAQLRWLGRSLVLDVELLTKKITRKKDNVIVISVFHHPLHCMNSGDHLEKYENKDTTLQHITNFVSLIFNGHTHGGVAEPGMLNNGVRTFRSGAIHSTDTEIFEFEIISLNRLKWSFSQSVGRYIDGEWKITPFNSKLDGYKQEFFSYGYKAQQILTESLLNGEKITDEKLNEIHPIISNILASFPNFDMINKNLEIKETNKKLKKEEIFKENKSSNLSETSKKIITLED